MPSPISQCARLVALGITAIGAAGCAPQLTVTPTRVLVQADDSAEVSWQSRQLRSLTLAGEPIPLAGERDVMLPDEECLRSSEFVGQTKTGTVLRQNIELIRPPDIVRVSFDDEADVEGRRVGANEFVVPLSESGAGVLRIRVRCAITCTFAEEGVEPTAILAEEGECRLPLNELVRATQRYTVTLMGSRDDRADFVVVLEA